MEADALASFRVKWTLKLAKAAAGVFADGTAAYRRRAALDSFAADADDWCASRPPGHAKCGSGGGVLNALT